MLDVYILLNLVDLGLCGLPWYLYRYYYCSVGIVCGRVCMLTFLGFLVHFSLYSYMLLVTPYAWST